ncbi:DUF3040 domain-containing protein [Tessaracoccus antarcticus]|uniref:DUF3040 domain-containing protein n=1 Tax=Tessaracoccus antarcticus TaxID=2479848 RepID=A0A3M0GB15_9ACTN|nr:DUF3040 domain-containing protein [Tessaracoccus antarcticus]RMB59682.1 DUF3040 domain-containing protein [Tessaracoccus antarcticus]
MALSEQERKLLEQLEASLMAEDPKFAQTLSGAGSIRVHRRRATLAGVGFVLGLLLLIGGVQIHPAVSIVGFVVMLASAIIGVNAWQRVSGEGQPSERPSDSPPPPKPTSQDFMEKLEERWRKRQEGGDL